MRYFKHIGTFRAAWYAKLVIFNENDKTVKLVHYNNTNTCECYDDNKELLFFLSGPEWKEITEKEAFMEML